MQSCSQARQLSFHREQHGEDGGSADEEEGGDEVGAWEAGASDEGVQVHRMAAGGGVDQRSGGGKKTFVAPVSKEKEMGRRKRYGLFLPLPGHVSGPTRSTVWDADDVNAHVRFHHTLEFDPALKPGMPKRTVSSASDEA